MASSSKNPQVAVEHFFHDLHTKLAPIGHAHPPNLQPQHVQLLSLFHDVYARFSDSTTDEYAIKTDIINDLNTQRKELRAIHKICHFGGGSLYSPLQVGNMESVRVRLTQLALVIHIGNTLNNAYLRMKTPRKLQLLAQDPEYTPEDRSFLESLHLIVSSRAGQHEGLCGVDSIFCGFNLDVSFMMQGLAMWPPFLLTNLGFNFRSLNERILVGSYGWEGAMRYMQLTQKPMERLYEARRVPGLGKMEHFNEKQTVVEAAFDRVRLLARRADAS